MRRLLGTVFAVLIGAGACSAESAAHLTVDEYRAEADLVCLEFWEAGLRLPQPLTESELETYVAESIVLAERAEQAWRAIDPPEAAAEVHAHLHESLTEVLDLLAVSQAAAIEADWDAFVEATDELTEAGPRFDEAAQAFGFEVCGHESRLTKERRDEEAARFCPSFSAISSGTPVTPEELRPIVQELVDGAPDHLRDAAGEFGALMQSTLEAFAATGATPGNPPTPEQVDEALAMLGDDEIALLDALVAATETGELPDGPLGELMRYGLVLCSPDGR